MNFKYDISVIVPVYNVEIYLRKCLDSLVNQTIKRGRMEVVLVDDGSTDSSPAIADEYAKKYDYIKIYHIENGGVSNARNFGIDHSNGKFIMFLDSDDSLTLKSVKSLVNFFEKHYDETDLVTYNETSDYDGILRPNTHYRYKYINETGVYNMLDPKYRYFIQTHMNFCIKNKGADNLKFDTTMTFHEDQKYIMTTLSEKHTIGFCNEAEYLYYKNTGGASKMSCSPYLIYEKTMELWESFMLKENVPEYVQGHFLNDFNWKINSGVLWPYQYEGEDFIREQERILTMLRKVNDDVILKFPRIHLFRKACILEYKYGDKLKLDFYDDKYSLSLNGENLINFISTELYLSRFRVQHGKLNVVGVIKSTACSYCNEVKLKATITKNGKVEEKYIELRDSSISAYCNMVAESDYKMFVIKMPLDGVTKISFDVFYDEHSYPVKFTYLDTIPFNNRLRRKSYVCENRKITLSENSFLFSTHTLSARIERLLRDVAFTPKTGLADAISRIRAPHYKKHHRVWLYCDSSKTLKDNAYFQFIHDVKKNDGVQRYYIYNQETDITGWFDDSVKDNLIPYGSKEHRFLLLVAEKLLSSFYGMKDITPYKFGIYKYFSDILNFEYIYLQHGVLHANLPTMYSLDRMMIDKEVISTHFEDWSLKKNYRFDDSFLIKCGMPRYNHIDKDHPAEKKILFAPSWRKYLVKSDGKGSWDRTDGKLLNSEFYKNVMNFLTSPELINALKEHGYVLDFKPHPNFRIYDDLFNVDGEYVRLAPKKVDEFSYSIFITDFSSFLFDFVYLKRPILYFIPDIKQFKGGLNHYRSLDYPLDEGFGAVSVTGEDTVKNVIKLIENNCVPEEKYLNKTNNLFFDFEDCEEDLYNYLMNE